jgi:hypothetical protein
MMKPTKAPHDPSGVHHEDQFHLLTLCLELQLDLLLVALHPQRAASRADRGVTSFPRWVGDVLDLTGEQPDADEEGAGPSAPGSPPSSSRGPAWLAGRYSAIADAIDEMLGNGEVRKNPSVLARLVQARSTCGERLAALPRHVPAPAPARDFGYPVEAGHYLG